MHVHDLNNYFDTPIEGGHVFTHTIHHLRFGPQLPEDLTKKLGSKANLWTNHHVNPLDNTEQITNEPAYNFMYFVKVVSTSYLPLGWEKQVYKSHPGSEGVGIGAYGHHHDGSVETHQYSVTSHRRSLNGGDDAAEGHKEKVHARGGIPGVFFSYVSFRFVILLYKLLTNYKGYFTNESHQQRRKVKELYGFLDWTMCHCWRYLDSCCCC